jgi:phosphoglucomutase
LQSVFTAEQLAAMPGDFEKLNSKIERAVADSQLMESAAKNIRALLAGTSSDFYLRVVDELVATVQWSELNDRFYQTLVFGTGGLRGRTIGKIVTTAERGNARENERPQFPCVGTNAMNFFNISRATQGLAAYLQDFVGSTESRPTSDKRACDIRTAT